MRVWRICRSAYAGVSGEGARLYGARWNSSGVEVVYAASHLSLSALEYLVHIDPEDVPGDLVSLAIDVPEGAEEESLSRERLPRGWRTMPPPDACARVGDEWASRGRTLVLRVPSVLIPEEDNVLLNPAHPLFEEVRVLQVRPFVYDPRLLRMGG